MRIGLVGEDGPGRLLQAPLITSTPGAPLPVEPRETLACQTILGAARQSARTGESLAVEDPEGVSERPLAGPEASAAITLACRIKFLF